MSSLTPPTTAGQRLRNRLPDLSPRTRITLLGVLAVLLVAIIILCVVRPWGTKEDGTLSDLESAATDLDAMDSVAVTITGAETRFEGSMDDSGQIIGQITAGDAAGALVSTGADVFVEGGPGIWEPLGFTGDATGWVQANAANLIALPVRPTLAQIAGDARSGDVVVNGDRVNTRGVNIRVLDDGSLEVRRGGAVLTYTGEGDMTGVEDSLAAASVTPARVVEADKGALVIDAPKPAPAPNAEKPAPAAEERPAP